jgi:hypothetical protein
MLLGFGSLVLLLQFKGDVFASSLDAIFYHLHGMLSTFLGSVQNPLS